MTPRTSSAGRARQCAHAPQPDGRGDRTNLSHHYGSIGIQAVAAAARYSDAARARPMRRSVRRLRACGSISASWSRQASRDHHRSRQNHRRPRATAAVIVCGCPVLVTNRRALTRIVLSFRSSPCFLPFFLAGSPRSGQEWRRRSKPFAGQASGSLMLAAYVPNGHSLERRDIVFGRGGARQRGLARSGQSRARRGQAGRAPARHRRADPRGDAGDRGLQPALRRESRALHDRDADVQFRHRDAEDHRR